MYSKTKEFIQCSLGGQVFPMMLFQCTHSGGGKKDTNLYHYLLLGLYPQVYTY